MKRMPLKLGSVLICLVFFATVLGGCATVQQNPATATGAGLGGATGALIGGIAGGWQGALIGGLAGVLAGGLIGAYIDSQERSAQQTARVYNYTPAQGSQVRIESLYTEPSTVPPGGRVKISMVYAVLLPNQNDSVMVKEIREVRYNGQVVATPHQEIQRQSGTWRSTLPLDLPAGAARGTYEVTGVLIVGQKTYTAKTSFQVS